MEGGGFKNPGFFLKIVEFIFGIICYALYMKYGNWSYGNSVRLRMVGEDIQVVAFVGYPFLILPALMTAFIVHKNFHKNTLNALLAFGGFICFLVGGALQLQNPKYLCPGCKALGALMIINAFFFLADFVTHFFFGRSK